MASKTVHPVETLREHATALEAAMTVVLPDPRKPAVHKVRAMVRRLEAQVELLAQLAALPAGSAGTGEVHRRVREMGRGACGGPGARSGCAAEDSENASEFAAACGGRASRGVEGRSRDSGEEAAAR